MGMSKYDRLLYILNLLRTRRNLNATRLAEECGVTERSIYRDIVALSEANIPIYYDRGYKMASDNFLPPLNFSLEEYASLRLALESSPLNMTGKHGAILKRVKAKVDAVLPETIKEQKRSLVETTHVDISMSVKEKRAERLYPIVEEAISRTQCLSLEYDSINSGVATRVVEPYFIVFRGRAFYLVAYCRLRKDFRTFRVDRMLSAKPAGESFCRDLTIKPETYFEGSWQLYSGTPVAVAVRLTGAARRVALAGQHHPNESIEKVSDDEIIYRVAVRGLDEIRRWIVGFGSEAEVLSPPELRESLRELGLHYTGLYSDQAG